MSRGLGDVYKRQVKEMQYLDEAFEVLRKQAGTAMPMWEKLRNEMPAWNTLQK